MRFEQLFTIFFFYNGQQKLLPVTTPCYSLIMHRRGKKMYSRDSLLPIYSLIFEIKLNPPVLLVYPIKISNFLPYSSISVSHSWVCFLCFCISNEVFEFLRPVVMKPVVVFLVAPPFDWNEAENNAARLVLFLSIHLWYEMISRTPNMRHNAKTINFHSGWIIEN